MRTINRAEEASRPQVHQRSWTRRRNALGVRNFELVVISIIALFSGIVVTFLTAAMGVQ